MSDQEPSVADGERSNPLLVEHINRIDADDGNAAFRAIEVILLTESDALSKEASILLEEILGGFYAWHWGYVDRLDAALKVRRLRDHKDSAKLWSNANLVYAVAVDLAHRRESRNEEFWGRVATISSERFNLPSFGYRTAREMCLWWARDNPEHDTLRLVAEQK